MTTTLTRRGFSALLAAVLVIAFAGAADAQGKRKGKGKRGPAVALRGQITAFDGGSLTIKSKNGDTITVAVPERVRVSTLTRVKFSELKKGDFIASAGMRQKDGTLKAIDVRIFPAKGRHPPEVHRRFRFGPDSTMTNATVDAFVGGVSGRTFKVKYKGGEKTITVPADAFVMRQNPGKKDLLKPGAHVSIFARKGKNGKIGVVRIAVGMNGLVPPT